MRRTSVKTAHRTAHATFSSVWLKTEAQAQGEADKVSLKRIVHHSRAIMSHASRTARIQDAATAGL